MRCDNCKRPIINPVDHEWCTYKAQPLPKTKSELAARIREVVVPYKPDEYVAPTVQGPINHQMAAPGARPKTSSLYYDKPSKHMFKRSNAMRKAIYRNFGKFNP